MARTGTLDDLDRKILRILMQDASIPYTDVARELGVSSGTIHVRMKKLTEQGVVRGSKLLVNPSALGYDIVALLGVFLEKGSAYNQARAAFLEIPEVVEMHFTTGTYNMIVKVVCRDTNHLREVLNEKLQPIEGVQRTETFISLDEPISREIQLETIPEAGI